MLRVLVSICLWISSASFAWASCDTAVISGPPVWPPFVNLAEDGVSRSGPAIDIATQALSELGVKVSLSRNKPWARTLRELQSGDVDLVFAMLKTAEREQFAQYTQAWIHDRYALVTKSSTSLSYTDPSSLNGFQGGYLNGIKLPEPFDQLQNHATNP